MNNGEFDKMRLDDDFEDYSSNNNGNKNLILYTILGVSLILLLIVAVVFLANNKANKKPPVAPQYDIAVSVDDLYEPSTLTAQDLDFWHAYDEEPTPEPSLSADVPEETPESLGPENDGKHTKITYADGSEEWIDINPYLALNTYNYSNLVYSNSIMKYYDNNVNSSFVGIDLSKNDDYVDFNRLKTAGVDYCMIRLGQRGYSTGEISLDDNFEDNITRANDAGLDIGVYFFSEAITKEEAEEEAEFVLKTLSGNGIDIDYPICYYLEDIQSSDVRTNTLNQLLRTNIAIAFMDKVREAGYIPMVYGNKEYLLKKLSFGSLIGYDVWLADYNDVPDFPYEFNMWQYTKTGSINGIPQNAKLSISFTDYSIR